MKTEDGRFLYSGDLVLFPMAGMELQVALLLSVGTYEASALVVWPPGRGAVVKKLYIVDSILSLAKGTEMGRVNIRYQQQRW